MMKYVVVSRYYNVLDTWPCDTKKQVKDAMKHLRGRNDIDEVQAYKLEKMEL
jgi:hypothetical protein